MSNFFKVLATFLVCLNPQVLFEGEVEKTFLSSLSETEEVQLFIEAVYRMDFYPEGELVIDADLRAILYITITNQTTGRSGETQIRIWSYDVYHNGMQMSCTIKNKSAVRSEICVYPEETYRETYRKIEERPIKT